MTISSKYNRNTKINSKKQERRVANFIGGKETVASGALYFQKADVREDTWLIECKTTANDYYILRQATWNKITKEAQQDGLRYPLMQIDLEDGKTSLVVFNYLDFIGFDFDKESYVRDEIKLVDKKSYRVNGDFLNLVPSKNIGHYINVEYFKFVDSQIHLVVMTLEDFLYLNNKYIKNNI